MPKIVKNKSILPKVKENRLSKENFEQELIKLLQTNKLFLYKEPILFLNITVKDPSNATIKYIVTNENQLITRTLKDNILFEKDLIGFLQKFGIIGNGRGLQRVEIECVIGEIPIIKIESNYFGIGE